MIDTYKDKGARAKLIDEIIVKGITDSNVLEAMKNVPRHFFFSKTFQSHAYVDKAFPIGEGQTISQPYTVAFQTQLLQIEKNDKVLEIGTGSGYQAAILAAMGAKVYSVERIEKLHVSSSALLKKLHYKVHLKYGDGSQGWKVHAPFDKIIVTAGAPVIPEELLCQLRTGGIMVIPVGNDKFQKMITIIQKANGKFEKLEFGNFSFVPLVSNHASKK